MSNASDREEEYRRQVEAFLLALQLNRGWNQSEIARRGSIHASAINKALARKHSLGWDVIENLAIESGIEIPPALKTAYRLRRQRAEQVRIEEAIQSSPELRRLLELGVELQAESDPDRKRAIREEMDGLIQKVA